MKVRLKGGEGGETKKPTAAELAAANKMAKDIAVRKGLIIGENAHVGNQIPKFYDARSGKDITGAPDPQLAMGNIATKVPLYVNSLEWDDKAQLPYYIDEKTGDTQYVHKDLFYSPRFNPNRGKSILQSNMPTPTAVPMFTNR